MQTGFVHGPPVGRTSPPCRLRSTSTSRVSYARRQTVRCEVQEFQAAESVEIKRKHRVYMWKGHAVNFNKVEAIAGLGSKPAILFIHGFGGSVNSWRMNMLPLAAAGHDVFALDLLGFGASDKPDIEYSIELWRELLVDFMQAQKQPGWVLVGNSIGSLTCLAVASVQQNDLVKGLVMVNCAGGLTSFRYSDYSPPFAFLVWLIKLLLFNDFVGMALFKRVARREQVKKTLFSIYPNNAAVTDELVNIIYEPAEDEGAVKVFLKVLNADAGPNPADLLGSLRDDFPILTVWGRQDPWTPLVGGVYPGEKFPSLHPNLELRVIDGGHCVYDEDPASVNQAIASFLTDKAASLV